MIRAVIFDFDGVIAESVNVKTDAFARLFEPEGPEIVERVLEHHLANGGVSRFDKFRFYYKEFLARPLSEPELDSLCGQFSHLVVEAVIDAPWVPGAQETLQYCRAHGYRLFIVSGTPQEEMRHIAERRGIAEYFEGIFGSPISKSQHIRSILEEYSLDPDEAVFVGDAVSDFRAAHETGVRFVARSQDPSEWEGYGISPMPDLAKLPEIIERAFDLDSA